MELAPVQHVMSLLALDSEKSPESETQVARDRKFAEEYTFFFFRDRPIKLMPDQDLMMMLYKRQVREKLRTVNKKDKLNKLFMRKRNHEEQDNHPDSDLDE
ncbi:hypothetical protein [Endozoicomonas sp. 4G]|uniref:hypothetical protein n=1 Tax=Endozoicomonas sp. 4G TaxID=2872754 RepID=UPI0020784F24|nr:hypothetical protein [Endozoicomonas sp. 4G]